MIPSLTLLLSLSTPLPLEDPWVEYPGSPDLPGSGKKVVLIAGDEEYRSEEALPMLGKVLARHHGFDCTVLFSTDKESGEINPDEQTNIPGLEKLKDADLAIVFLRFRELPDEDMTHFVEYARSGRPIIGIRTSTHAFAYKRNTESPFASWSWRNSEWPGGFGKQILGETWVAHHGGHGSQSTLGVPEPGNEEHPILRGLNGDVWGPTDVYAAAPPEDATILLRGAVLDGMTQESKPVEGGKNDPMMPIAWIREVEVSEGNKARVFCSTLGASTDLQTVGSRRLFVNAAYWCVGLEAKITDSLGADVVGDYEPTPFGFRSWVKGRRASDHAFKE